jgi:hypothetical protein
MAGRACEQDGETALHASLNDTTGETTRALLLVGADPHILDDVRDSTRAPTACRRTMGAL